MVLSFSAIVGAQGIDGEFRPPEEVDDALHLLPQASSLPQDTPTPQFLHITLPAVTSSEQAKWESRDDFPLQIGFGREIPAAYRDDLAPRLEWTTLSNGTLLSALSVTSPGAKALRIAVSASLPAGAELRFFSPAGPIQTFAPLTDHDFAPQTSELPVDPPEYGPLSQTDESTTVNDPLSPDPPVWSPVIEGETVGIEITLPSSAALSTFSLYVSQVSHIVQSMSMSEPQYKPRQLGDINRAECSHIDVQCVDVDEQASMTAKMTYIKDGGSYLCTGTLMNDTDDSSFIPYFLTAHHCISTQAAAQTLVTYWDFERASCGSPAPTNVTQLTGGADLLATHSESDSTLLRLRRDPPLTQGGRWYSGWDAGEVSRLTSVFGVHHPRGDLKKYATGTAESYPFCLDDGDGGCGQNVSHGLGVLWSQGVVEGGSSGSGLFGFGAGGRLRGVLSGSPDGCSEHAGYGSLAGFFPHARRWLAGGAPPVSDDHGDTGDEATRVALGSSTWGHLESPGDMDYFRFEISAAGTLTVYTTGNTDTYGNLWGNDQWLDWDDDGGVGYNFQIERMVSPGTYFIRVRGYDEDSTTGQYTLVVRFLRHQSTLDFSITDSCNDGQAIRYRFFEDTDDISQFSTVWPSWDRVYVAEVYGRTYTSRLACTPGYKVCFGARDGRGYWGVDIDASEGCESCCTWCPTSGRASFSRNLVCE